MILRTRNTSPTQLEPGELPRGRPLDPTCARRLVQQMMVRSGVPGLAVAVSRGGGDATVDAFGHADLATPVLTTPATRFPWFSMTKLVTATAALQLADEGRLDLDAPVTELLPWLPVHASAVPTTRQLLTHTAGLANPLPVRWVHPATEPSPDQSELARRLVTSRAFARSPGGQARYSNLGYLLVAEAVSEVSGRPFPEHVQSAVLRPLAMTSTGFTASEAGSAVGYLNLPRPLSALAAGVLPAAVRGPVHGRLRSLRPFLVDGAGYGGLVGPVTDAARFLRMHLNDGELDGVRILSAETARRMRTVVSRGRPFEHATGWFRRPTGSESYLEHYGSGAGFWNVMRIYPEHDLGITIMTNSSVSYPFHPLMTSITGVR